ncbi:MAG TPA: selenide, water dikinase SelD, partial [Atribacterota bacterium]|nr:selenide, water dikinase SelD [Atribacterota bacterium]
QEGDSLILTKPLGTGVISTALKAAEITISEAQEAIRWMIKLNNISDHILNLPINSMTDITGFGFLGHLNEMLKDSELGADIEISEVPLLEKALYLSEKNIVPGGSLLNQKFFSCLVEKKINLDFAKEILFYDAQTSGGLLISIRERDCEYLLELLKREGFSESRVVGNIRKNGANDKKIRLV